MLGAISQSTNHLKSKHIYLLTMFSTRFTLNFFFFSSRNWEITNQDRTRSNTIQYYWNCLWKFDKCTRYDMKVLLLSWSECYRSLIQTTISTLHVNPNFLYAVYILGIFTYSCKQHIDRELHNPRHCLQNCLTETTLTSQCHQ